MGYPQNTGFLEGIQPTDYIAGESSGLVYEERLEDGQWGSLLVAHEIQRGAFDTMACVSYSALNVIEMQVRYLTGKELNFSDRFLATMSETTPQGNYLFKVAETLRKKGVVLESEYPNNPTIDETWDKYYAPVPEDTQKKALEFLEEFDVQYEWVHLPNPYGASKPFDAEEVKRQLKHAPLQIAVPICSPWNRDGVVTPCGSTQSNHAITLYGYDERGWLVYDHYNPTRKVLSYDYPIPHVFKILLTKKSNKAMEYLEKNENKLVQNAETGEFGIIKGGKVLKTSAERAGLLALTTLIRNGYGGGVPAKLWDEFPKEDF